MYDYYQDEEDNDGLKTDQTKMRYATTNDTMYSH